MLADVEVVIDGAQYHPERDGIEDEVADVVRGFMLEQVPAANDVRVWLNLSQIVGYSFGEEG